MSQLTTSHIRHETAIHNAFRNRLLAELPDIDAETLADTLEGLTNLRETLVEVIRSALDDEALASGLSARLADMKQRLDRLAIRAEKKRKLALQAMSEADILKLLAPEFTASLRQGAPVLSISSAEKIPTEYWKLQPSKLDRQGLLTALKSGVKIEGVNLAAPELQLTIRTK